MITINSNEASKHDDIQAYFLEHQVKYEIKPIEAGDFQVSGVEDKELYERKTMPDFVSSVYGRLWEQLAGLAEAHHEQTFSVGLILEYGYFYDAHARGRQVSWPTWLRKHPEKEVGFYMSQRGAQRWRVPFILTKDSVGTARFLEAVDIDLGSAKEPKEYPKRSGFKKNWTIGEKREYLFNAFGAETGKALLKHHAPGRPADVIHWYEKDGVCTPKEDAIEMLSNIKMESGRRIGKTKATEIWEVLFG